MQMWDGASCDSQGTIRCPLAEDPMDREANPVVKMQSVAQEARYLIESVVIDIIWNRRASY